MLGFRQDIASSDSLSVFFDFISLGSVLTNTDADYEYKGNISSYKYKIEESDRKISIGIEEQN